MNDTYLDYYIQGIPPGCGIACRNCAKEQREVCWLYLKSCDLGLNDIGDRKLCKKKEKSE